MFFKDENYLESRSKPENEGNLGSFKSWVGRISGFEVQE